MKTSIGLKVSGLQKSFNPKQNVFTGYSGRVRVVLGDPFYDDYAKWDNQGNALNHEYGNINPKDL